MINTWVVHVVPTLPAHRVHELCGNGSPHLNSKDASESLQTQTPNCHRSGAALESPHQVTEPLQRAHTKEWPERGGGLPPWPQNFRSHQCATTTRDGCEDLTWNAEKCCTVSPVKSQDESCRASMAQPPPRCVQQAELGVEKDNSEVLRFNVCPVGLWIYLGHFFLFLISCFSCLQWECLPNACPTIVFQST